MYFINPMYVCICTRMCFSCIFFLAGAYVSAAWLRWACLALVVVMPPYDPNLYVARWVTTETMISH